MGTLLEDLNSAAAWISDALTSSGYQADFTGPSLWSVDRFFDEHAPNGKARRGGLLATDLGNRIFALGAYLGEVIRRNVGGVWEADENDPQAEINVRLILNDGTILWPIQRVMKRFRNGSEDGIAVYAAALGVAVGEWPSPKPRRRFFR